ncbi:putative acetyltransferase [Stackebrandtia endophytica]|uniref:Putative acetyltransferase n=1 Tax=Stackebrandtia endophytica TaxID=1496996 RepID=A0A543AQJ8_9ACTN|nr:GNAT family N-acetyltransferase [Stackebrandtia endophytica]TQL74805.1 putative acetyltransferase [Stackebrandtia endophytica]
MTGFDYAIRTATIQDFTAVINRFTTAMMVSDNTTELDRELFEPDRTLVAEDAGSIVGVAQAFTRTLSVPGTVSPAAHVTGVAVAATHRRMGILSRIMRRQLAEVPEPVAVLWASQPGIYERFGYQASVYGHRFEAKLAEIRLTKAPVEGRLCELSVEQAASELPPILKRLQLDRPGVSGRSDQLWKQRLADPPERRDGRMPRQLIGYRSPEGDLEGYVFWRGTRQRGSDDGGNTVEVEELVAATGSAYRALWQHVLTMDLATRLVSWHAAVDEPVRQLVGNPRALGVRSYDALWLRIVDVAAALAQRRYACAVDVVLEVSDDILPANNRRFRLTGDRSTASCVETGDEPDLSLSVAELSGVYLGGRRLTEYAAVGRVHEHREGALAEVTTAMGWPVAPRSIEVF